MFENFIFFDLPPTPSDLSPPDKSGYSLQMEKVNGK